MSARAVVSALAVAVVAGLGGFGALAGAAVPGSGEPSSLSPEGVELTTALPGFTQAPPGAFNGPVSTTTLLTYTTDVDVIGEIEKGTVSAYLRSWSRPFDDQDGVLADLVVKFPQAAQVTGFLTGLKSALSSHSGVSTFTVKSPSGAVGYLTHNVIVAGSTDVAVSLGRGDYATLIVGATPEGNVSESQVELMAAAQWGALPDKNNGDASDSAAVSLPTKLPALLPASDLSSSGAGGMEALLIVVVFVVGLVVLVLWAGDVVGRRRARRRSGAGEAGDPGGPGEPGEAGEPGGAGGGGGEAGDPEASPVAPDSAAAAGQGVGA